MEDRESLASSVPDISVSPASPNEVKSRAQSNGGQPSAPNVSNGAVPRRKVQETRRRFPFPFKKEFSPLMRRKNQRQNKKHSSNEDVNGSLHRDSLMEDGSASDSNEDEEGINCTSRLLIYTVSNVYSHIHVMSVFIYSK